MMDDANTKRRCTPYIPETCGPDGRGRGEYGMGRGGYGYGGGYGMRGHPQMNVDSYGRGMGGAHRASKEAALHLLNDCSLDCFTKVKLAVNKRPDDEFEVQIANEMMGSVIDKGGSRINEIRALSTEIKIHSDDGENSNNSV